MSKGYIEGYITGDENLESKLVKNAVESKTREAEKHAMDCRHEIDKLEANLDVARKKWAKDKGSYQAISDLIGKLALKRILLPGLEREAQLASGKTPKK